MHSTLSPHELDRLRDYVVKYSTMPDCSDNGKPSWKDYLLGWLVAIYDFICTLLARVVAGHKDGAARQLKPPRAYVAMYCSKGRANFE